jgi:hypothetical protein
MNFEVGQVFKDKQGNTYTLLSRDKEFGIFKFNAIPKKFKIIQYCGAEAVVQYGEILFQTEKKLPYDEEFDAPKVAKVVKINNNNQRYIDVFKRHKFSAFSTK